MTVITMTRIRVTRGGALREAHRDFPGDARRVDRKGRLGSESAARPFWDRVEPRSIKRSSLGQQRGWVYLKALSDPLDGTQGQIPLTSLESTHVGPVHPEHLREGFLAQPSRKSRFGLQTRSSTHAPVGLRAFGLRPDLKRRAQADERRTTYQRCSDPRLVGSRDRAEASDGGNRVRCQSRLCRFSI
jgi:hypothetical protein